MKINALRFMPLLVPLLVAGCSPAAQMRVMENQKMISVAPAQEPGHDYVVALHTVRADNFEFDRKEDREKIALRFLASQCPAGQVVGETEVVLRDFRLNLRPRQDKLYSVKVKCRGSAPPPLAR